MTKTVWKFPLVLSDSFLLEIPKGAQLLCVGAQNNHPMLWALVDSSKPKEARHFRLAGTGHSIETYVVYIGSCQTFGGSLVWHLFEHTEE